MTPKASALGVPPGSLRLSGRSSVYRFRQRAARLWQESRAPSPAPCVALALASWAWAVLRRRVTCLPGVLGPSQDAPGRPVRVWASPRIPNPGCAWLFLRPCLQNADPCPPRPWNNGMYSASQGPGAGPPLNLSPGRAAPRGVLGGSSPVQPPQKCQLGKTGSGGPRFFPDSFQIAVRLWGS